MQCIKIKHGEHGFQSKYKIQDCKNVRRVLRHLSFRCSRSSLFSCPLCPRRRCTLKAPLRVSGASRHSRT